ncbi:MAG: hypothetical protein EOP48_33375 [Sphingobacteriales bacterium]|nr:MAG: hypothetical protein EOP48_33375 [Sphingobacteriales bacterium]
MSLSLILSSFRTEVATSLRFITKSFSQDAAGTYFLTSDEQSFIVDSAFLRLFIAWEGFLENSFIHYILGNPSSTGKSAVRHATPPSEQHARDMLIGTQKYVDWANPQIICKLSKLYLKNGEPIEPTINSIQSDLFDIKTVRNAAAHLTSSTGRSLDALASRRLQHTCTNITVSDFILSQDPAAGASGSILDGYSQILDVCAEKIANWA